MRVFALVRSAADLRVVQVATALGETTVVSVAPDDEATQALLSGALAAGALSAIRLWDAALGDTDYLGVAYTLAATVRAAAGDVATPSTPTLIICGDGGSGGVGAAVAERLALPHLGQVLSAEERDGKLIVRRAARGMVRLYSAAPPALICLAPSASAPAPVPAPESAPSVLTWSLSKVGLSPAEVGYRRRFRPQPATGPVPRALEFSDARALAERLRADGLLPASPRLERP